MRQKLLFIAPISNTPNGQSIVSEAVLEVLEKKFDVTILNINKNSHNTGIDSLHRIIQIITILFKCIFYSFKVDKFYLTVSESIAGNFRDIIIYICLYRQLPKSYIHVHGGKLKISIFDKSSVLKSINKFFISKLKGAIVLGESLRSILHEVIDSEKIFVANNFYEDFLLSTPQKIEEKYKLIRPLKILYLSNFYHGKGYEYFLEGLMLLDAEHMSQLDVTFAGGFDSDDLKKSFLRQIANYSNIKYAGIVRGKQKKELLMENHVLCFPSYIEEGQGISIIEGYANGCFIMTTGVAGIGDIFENNKNGLKFKPKSSKSIRDVILKLLQSSGDNLYKIGVSNYNLALSKYNKKNYFRKIEHIID